MEIKPIKRTINKLVDEFLDDENYFNKFEDIAQTYGVVSDNPDVIKVAMFSTKGDEIIFVDKELEELFLEWQLFIQLIDTEPYATLIREKPERKPQVVILAHKLLDGAEISNEDIIELFKGVEYEGSA